jgi:hypothetical protein
MNKAEENVFRLHIEKLEKTITLMVQLSTINGFYQNYFEKLRNAKSNIEAFNQTNDMYFSLFGKYRYSDHDSFKKTIHYHKNKLK